METPDKQNVQNTTLTLKDAVKDQNYLQAYEIILRDTRYRYKNHYYDD